MLHVSAKNKLVIFISLCSSLSFGQNNSSLEHPKDTTEFYHLIHDINNDSKADIIYWSKHLSGDSLFVFPANGTGYISSLQTISFSDDGLYVVNNVSIIEELQTH